MKDLSYLPKTPNTGGWQDRHRAEIRNAAAQVAPIYPGPAVGLVKGLQGWIDYAMAHAARFGSPIGEDYVLGPAWARWGFALRELLNGNCGQLDCGTLDAIIRGNLSEQGFDEDAP